MATQKPFAFGTNGFTGQPQQPANPWMSMLQQQPFSFGTEQPQLKTTANPGAGDPWALLARALQPQTQQGIDIPGILKEQRNDPQGDANKAYIPGQMNGASPFGNGFFQNSASQMTPEARLASQGPSAANQWASLGQTPGVDATALQGLNQTTHDTRQNNIHPFQNPALGAVGASPKPFQLDPQTLALLQTLRGY